MCYLFWRSVASERLEFDGLGTVSIRELLQFDSLSTEANSGLL